MVRYNINGTYWNKVLRQQNRAANLIGMIDLLNEGDFVGDIENSPSGIPVNYRIIGSLSSSKGLSRLAFDRLPFDEELPALRYELSKESSNTFEGEYIGTWEIIPYNTFKDEKTGLYFPRKESQYLITSVINVYDEVKIELSKKP